MDRLGPRSRGLAAPKVGETLIKGHRGGMQRKKTICERLKIFLERKRRPSSNFSPPPPSDLLQNIARPTEQPCWEKRSLLMVLCAFPLNICCSVFETLSFPLLHCISHHPRITQCGCVVFTKNCILYIIAKVRCRQFVQMDIVNISQKFAEVHKL